MSLTISPDIRAQMAPAAAALDPYDPHFTPVEVNLSANENPFGLPAAVAREVARAVAATPTNRYPSPLADDLRRDLATLHGVAPEQVIVGNGGDELLFNLFVAFGGPGRTIIDCPPTFSVYRTYAELVGTTVVDVPRTSAFGIDMAALRTAMAATPAALTIVTTPNNPTGNTTDVASLAALCDATPGIVLADQAYVEFAAPGADATVLLASHPNLVILRTFSKAYALAGLRVGYVLASEGVAAALAAVRQPYSVNVLAQAAARVVVANRGACAQVLTQIVAERANLTARLTDLAGLGVTVFPSEANFLLVRVPAAHRVWERLRDEHSVLVRDVSRVPGLDSCLRVTVGTPAENERLLAGLTTIVR